MNLSPKEHTGILFDLNERHWHWWWAYRAFEQISKEVTASICVLLQGLVESIQWGKYLDLNNQKNLRFVGVVCIQKGRLPKVSKPVIIQYILNLSLNACFSGMWLIF